MANENNSDKHIKNSNSFKKEKDGKPDVFPPQVKFIIGTEGCERFSFYGMKNILTMFMIQYMLLEKSVAESKYHLFVSAVYFFPLLGGILADRFLGKYRTIMWLSLLYCMGHACLAIFDQNPTGFYAGLALIALGSGGIKPCVSAFVGDQFKPSEQDKVQKVFAIFYWIINFGSFFASAIIPKTLKWYGPSVAFGIPGILMFIATIIFWRGRHLYVDTPPTGKNPHSFLNIVKDAILNRKHIDIDKKAHFLDFAIKDHPIHAINGAKAVFRVIMIFLPIPIFWALFDQKGSTWVVQAEAMNRNIVGFNLEPSQLLALNPLLVMILIPLNQTVVYPLLSKLGFELTPLRRITLGMFVAGFSFVCIGLLQIFLDSGVTLSVLWQILPYTIITFAEVLVSVTGLEFAYSQAPREMKGTIMSLWNLTVTFGNLITASISELNVFKGSSQYFFYAILIFIASAFFALIANWFNKTSLETKNV